MKKERINKETGELSASGELSVSMELKEEKVEGSSGNSKLLQVLRKQLEELEIYTYSNHDHKTGHQRLPQLEQHLPNVLHLYTQVYNGLFVFDITVWTAQCWNTFINSVSHSLITLWKKNL